jgi:hypothetical protein
MEYLNFKKINSLSTGYTEKKTETSGMASNQVFNFINEHNKANNPFNDIDSHSSDKITIKNIPRVLKSNKIYGFVFKIEGGKAVICFEKNNNKYIRVFDMGFLKQSKNVSIELGDVISMTSIKHGNNIQLSIENIGKGTYHLDEKLIKEINELYSLNLD